WSWSRAMSSGLPVALIAPGAALTPNGWKLAAVREACPSPSTCLAIVPASVAWKPTVSALARLCETAACERRVALAPVIATYMALSIMGIPPSVIPANAGIQARRPHSSADVDHRLGDLVLGGDHLGVGLEVPLRGDHVHQLLGQVDVRRLQRTALHQPELRRAGGAHARVAR